MGQKTSKRMHMHETLDGSRRGSDASSHGVEQDGKKVLDPLALAVRDFGSSLSRVLTEETTEENVFLSPYGASVCLALALLGARQETLAQMLTVLAIQPPLLGHNATPHEDGPVSAEWLRDHLAPVYSALAVSLQRDAERSGTKLLQANAAVVNVGHAVLAKGQFQDPHHPVRMFAEMIKRHMAAKLIEAADPQRAGLEADAFAAQETKGLVKELGLELDDSTLMVLLNAIYFKANFAHKFDKRMTQQADFTCLPGGNKSKVQMMQKFAKMNYAEDEGLQAVRLDYAGRQAPFSLVVALHRDASAAGLQVAMRRFSGPDALQCLQFGTRKGRLFLPRFKFETRRELKVPLQKLGMVDAFGHAADFSGILRGAYLSQVVHKAVVEVNEEGTEAAAVTAAVVCEECLVREDPPFEMRCDRPFVFVIEHRPSGLPLFMGVVRKL